MGAGLWQLRNKENNMKDKFMERAVKAGCKITKCSNPTHPKGCLEFDPNELVARELAKSTGRTFHYADGGHLVK